MSSQTNKKHCSQAIKLLDSKMDDAVMVNAEMENAKLQQDEAKREQDKAKKEEAQALKEQKKREKEEAQRQAQNNAADAIILAPRAKRILADENDAAGRKIL